MIPATAPDDTAARREFTVETTTFGQDSTAVAIAGEAAARAEAWLGAPAPAAL